MLRGFLYRIEDDLNAPLVDWDLFDDWRFIWSLSPKGIEILRDTDRIHRMIEDTADRIAADEVEPRVREAVDEVEPRA